MNILVGYWTEDGSMWIAARGTWNECLEKAEKIMDDEVRWEYEPDDVADKAFKYQRENEEKVCWWGNEEVMDVAILDTYTGELHLDFGDGRWTDYKILEVK